MISPCTAFDRRSAIEQRNRETLFAGSIAQGTLGHIVGDKVEAPYRQEASEAHGAFAAWRVKP
jgi:hypothetical protein